MDTKKIHDKIDTKKIIENLEKIISIPSPTGYTELISDYLMDFASKNKIDAIKTNKGSIIYSFGNKFNESFKTKGICFAAHVDTLGLMVKSVSKDSIKATPIGGIPPIYCVGDYVSINASDGNIYYGTILPENPAAHVNRKLDELIPKYDELYVRLDHIFTEEDKIDSHIQIGDFIFLNPKFKYINGYVKTRFLDDKASAAIFLSIAEILSKTSEENKLVFLRPIYFYFNITEETGQGIASLPEIEDLFIVDMGVVGTGVSGDEFSVSICPKDSSGPYNYLLTKKLEDLCKKNDIKYKKDVFPYYGSDGSVALRSGQDIKVALFGVGVSASHGYERTHEVGLYNTAKLLASIIEQQIEEVK